MDVDWGEFRDGVAESRQYLLSHHPRERWYRCYTPKLLGRRVRICARCSGIYPGIVLGLVAYYARLQGVPNLALVALLPLPALLDWTITTFTERRGYNVVRSLTGLALGFGYGLGFGLLFGQFDVRVLGIGAGYALAAGALLVLETADRKVAQVFK